MKNIILLILVCWQFTLYAAEPFIWKQTPDSAPVILPRKDNQTYEEALKEYFQKVNETPSLADLLRAYPKTSLKEISAQAA